MKPLYDTLFSKYIGKRISIRDTGYYIGGDYVVGRYFVGILTQVKIERDKLVFVFDCRSEISVSFNTEMEIISNE